MRRFARTALFGAAMSLVTAAPVMADGHHHRGDSDHEAVPDETVPDEPASDDAAEVSPDSDSPPAAPDEAAGDEPATVTSTEPDTVTSTEPATVTSTDQSVTITGVAVAVSTTGANTASGTGTEQDATAGAQQVATGDASAVGNDDQTTVDQDAAVTLSGEATADVVQVVIVFNVGVAGANTGANSATGSSTGGAIATGDATAVGNDSSTYVTQGATATAPDGTDDSSSQVTITVRLGVAVADTGTNSAGGSVAGSVSTGTATAVGNQSVTDVSQSAALSGSDSSQLTVDQRAMVINLGIALANAGVNDVNGVAGALLDSPSQELAEQLFTMLLPALLASASSGAAGSVTTGDALAVGNQSTTVIDQTAIAAAAGDGSASIDQRVVVANFGAALANTGLNGTGTAAVDPAVVAQLAAFFADLLATLEEWTSGVGDAESVSLSIPFGDMVIALDGNLGGTTTTASAGDASAIIRQLTAIISLGVSFANTGINQTSAVAPPAASAVDAASGVLITTGDAIARNSSVVVVCQLDDAPNVTCLTPPPDEHPTPAVGAVSAVSGVLPETGADATLLVQLAALLVAAGAGLFLVSRRAALR